jgi:hypothetical protein
MTMSTRESRFEELEVYRTAQEFRCIARRIEQALPPRKQDVKLSLETASAGILAEIARAWGMVALEERGLRRAQVPVSTCQHILDQLSIINMGGKADVTAGIEILERLSELLGAEPAAS